jgi:hypothetical protein
MRHWPDLCEPEVQNLRLSTQSHKNIVWFGVSVDDPLRVRRVEPVGNVNSQVK